ncbi:putative interleukin-17 receptor E-like [Scophthalmus maximus]|uniref:Putative interleukin-17 receptor E-like n=1 Tax=Scophthalmus maximus TaxID=52904 RepID=A0A2U9BZZ8_SCOMX|nr:putative interleukin-17 receptor E-like [Scophthalmus maximus]
MRPGTALALICALVFSPQLECATTCQKSHRDGRAEGRCPVELTPAAPSLQPGDMYSECVALRVWIRADDFCKAAKIEILSPYKETIWPTLKKRRHKNKCLNERHPDENRIWCYTQQIQQSNTSFSWWELVYDCVKAEAGSVVSVSYNTTSSGCTDSYTVPDPVPEFDLSVNRSSKSITVTVELGEKVHTRWCYRRNAEACMDGSASPQLTIDPSQSRLAVLNIPYMLPCVCIQVYYTFRDACRDNKCPLQKEGLTDIEDVWRSSEVTLYESAVKWSSVCPASGMNISALLCWKQREHLCIPVVASTLEKMEDGPNLKFNTSTVDKHPKMCVQFSLQGSHNISCPFQADMTSWEVHIGSGRQRVFVYLTSFAPATFSIQLCVVNKMGCEAIGPVHTIRMERKTAETRMNVPPHYLVQRPCVQVWQSDPALKGRRILCPDYAHNRCGMYAMAALILVVFIALLGIFLHHLTRSGAAGWLWIQKPVLLVFSSEQSAHVSAACALASFLQGELNATVHMALWAQSSQKQTGARTGVADLGPLPWLYGQWENIRKAQGKVLIIWSPEAKTTYEKWEERETLDKNERKKEDDGKNQDVEEDYKLNGKRLAKCKKAKAAGKEECVRLCDDEDWYQQTEPSSVIAPIFAGALALLQGSLQQCRGQEVAIVYFQGLGHSRDVPKALRGVPRYCLPQDFSGLIQELGGMRRGTTSDSCPKCSRYGWHSSSPSDYRHCCLRHKERKRKG